MSRRTRVTFAFLVGILAVLLSGCYQASADVTVHSDDTMSGRIFIGVTSAAPGGAFNKIDDEKIRQFLPDATIVEKTDTLTGARGKVITFTKAPITAFESPELFAMTGVRMEIEKSGSSYNAYGTANMTHFQMPDDAYPVLMISMTFPGEVGHSNGAIHGRSVMWQPEHGTTTEMTATGSSQRIPTGAIVGGLMLLTFGGLAGFARYKFREPSKHVADKLEKVDFGRPKPHGPNRFDLVDEAVPVFDNARLVEPPSQWWLDAPTPLTDEELALTEFDEPDTEPRDVEAPDDSWFDEADTPVYEQVESGWAEPGAADAPAAESPDESEPTAPSPPTNTGPVHRGRPADVPDEEIDIY